jgi:hypothetical protein
MIQHYAKISKVDKKVLKKALDIALEEESRYLTNKKRLKKIKGKA